MPEQGCSRVRIHELTPGRERSFACDCEHAISILFERVSVHLETHEERDGLVELHALRRESSTMTGELRERDVGNGRASQRKQCAKSCVGGDLAALDRVG